MLQSDGWGGPRRSVFLAGSGGLSGFRGRSVTLVYLRPTSSTTLRRQKHTHHYRADSRSWGGGGRSSCVKPYVSHHHTRERHEFAIHTYMQIYLVQGAFVTNLPLHAHPSPRPVGLTHPRAATCVLRMWGRGYPDSFCAPYAPPRSFVTLFILFFLSIVASVNALKLRTINQR